VGAGRLLDGEEGEKQEIRGRLSPVLKRGRKSRRDTSGPRENPGISTTPSNGVASWDDNSSRGVRAAMLVARQASHRRPSPSLPTPIGSLEIIMCISYTGLGSLSSGVVSRFLTAVCVETMYTRILTR
jgi:hypothetical protein